MKSAEDDIAKFYQTHLPDSRLDKGVLTAACPFCRQRGMEAEGRLAVILNPGAFFHGYFRCLSRCVAGGFPAWFGQLLALLPESVPGYDPDRHRQYQAPDFPLANSNGEMRASHEQLSDEISERFAKIGVQREVLNELQIGYNGRYITYPYVQTDGNCYSVRCVHPDRPEDYFWQGHDRFAADPFRLFNVQDIERCRNGALFLCEGEDNLLVIRQYGYPGVAVPHHQVFEAIDPEQFQAIRTVFLVAAHNGEAEHAARELASRIGFKVRLLSWAPGTPRNYSLADMARDQGRNFRQAVTEMIRRANAFSPFAAPEREYDRFRQQLHARGQEAYTGLLTGFPLLDEALEGLHGINVIGGAPKVGKSAFAIQVASQMAEQGMPVLYYDFENGRQQLYQRILSRLSRLEVSTLTAGGLQDQERQRYETACARIRKMLNALRVVNDRKLSPELMRRHIDFIRHETRSEYCVVVIDSLHKLPFKDFSERRTGIDAWLRQLESIRDELQVSFLVISELSRGAEKAYSERPHLGVFKGSGDIEYSADNAMVLFPASGQEMIAPDQRRAVIWVVASREHTPGPVASYQLDYPYWGFVERPVAAVDIEGQG